MACATEHRQWKVPASLLQGYPRRGETGLTLQAPLTAGVLAVLARSTGLMVSAAFVGVT